MAYEFDSLVDEFKIVIDDIGDTKFKIGDRIENLTIQGGATPILDYSYINIGMLPDYCFNHAELRATSSIHYPGLTDHDIYFHKVQKLCKTSFDDLIDNSHHSDHFHIISRPSRQLLRAAEDFFGHKLTPETTPSFGQFALYTNKMVDGEETKAPRIFFFVGRLATIHILFYDPYHSIYQHNT